MVSDKVTTTADLKLKLEFEMTFGSSKVDYKKALEEGMLKRIEEVNPVKACEMRIEKLKRILEEEEAKLANYKLLEQMEKITPKKQTKNVDPNLERLRLDKFEKWKESLAFQVNTGNIDWKKIMEIYVFNSTTEAREWIISHLKEGELLE